MDKTLITRVAMYKWTSHFERTVFKSSRVRKRGNDFTTTNNEQQQRTDAGTVKSRLNCLTKVHRLKILAPTFTGVFKSLHFCRLSF